MARRFPQITAKHATVAICVLSAAAVVVIAVRSARYIQGELHPARREITPDERARAARLPGLVEAPLVTSDGMHLGGWYVPSKNGAAVILAHGVGQNRAAFLAEAEALSARGYGVMLFDARAHGDSEGNLCTWGDHEQRDVRAALEDVARRPDVDRTRIGALGFSMGAASVVMVAKEDARLSALVLAGCSTSLRESTEYDLHRWGFLGMWPALWVFRANGIDPDHVDPPAALRAMTPRPVLVVSGGLDPYVPRFMTSEILAASPARTELYFVEGAGHGEYAESPGGAAYVKRVVEFFDAALAK